MKLFLLPPLFGVSTNAQKSYVVFERRKLLQAWKSCFAATALQTFSLIFGKFSTANQDFTSVINSFLTFSSALLLLFFVVQMKSNLNFYIPHFTGHRKVSFFKSHNYATVSCQLCFCIAFLQKP